MNFRHLVKVTSRILHGKYSAYSRLTLFGIYCRLIFKAFLHYKFEYQGKYGLEEEIFGFHIHFHSYSELINLFEEIFIFEVYRNTRRDAELIIDGGSNIGLSVIYFRMIFPRSE